MYAWTKSVLIEFACTAPGAGRGDLGAGPHHWGVCVFCIATIFPLGPLLDSSASLGRIRSGTSDNRKGARGTTCNLGSGHTQSKWFRDYTSGGANYVAPLERNNLRRATDFPHSSITHELKRLRVSKVSNRAAPRVSLRPRFLALARHANSWKVAFHDIDPT